MRMPKIISLHDGAEYSWCFVMVDALTKMMECVRTTERIMLHAFIATTGPVKGVNRHSLVVVIITNVRVWNMRVLAGMTRTVNRDAGTQLRTQPRP